MEIKIEVGAIIQKLIGSHFLCHVTCSANHFGLTCPGDEAKAFENKKSVKAGDRVLVSKRLFWHIQLDLKCLCHLDVTRASFNFTEIETHMIFLVLRLRAANSPDLYINL